MNPPDSSKVKLILTISLVTCQIPLDTFFPKLIGRNQNKRIKCCDVFADFRIKDSCVSHLNHEVHLGVHEVLRGQPALAGRVHRVTSTAAPRHSHVTVVGEPRDPLTESQTRDRI